jgi:hypothetical protein
MSPEQSELSEALASNFMLVDMQLRSWSGKATDRKASTELITSKNASSDSGTFVKNLLASANAELKAVHTRGNAMRTFVYGNTLPWSASDGAKRGERLLSTKKAIQFLQDLNTYKKDYDDAVLELVNVWPSRVTEAMSNLGALADQDDYPDANELATLFSVAVDLKPIPAMGDFSRLNVPAELAAALGQRHAMAAQVQVSNAMNDLRDRFIEELQRIEKQMSKAAAGEKTRLYETLITNMQVLVDMAKHMNLTGNSRLDELAARIEAKVLARPISAYKDNAPLANQLAQDAKELAVEAMQEEIWQ